jgi:hypothetical protein
MFEVNSCDLIDQTIRRSMILVLIKDYCDRNQMSFEEFLNNRVASVAKHSILNTILREKEALMKSQGLLTDSMLNKVLVSCKEFEDGLDDHLLDHIVKAKDQLQGSLDLMEVQKSTLG